MRKADGNQPLGLGGVEREQRIELLDFLAGAILQPIDVGELLPRRDEGRRDGDGPNEGGARFGELFAIFQAQAQHVMRFVKSRVELHRLLQGRNRAGEPAIAARRQRELVENLGRVVVEADVGLVVFGGIREAPKLEIDVAQLFERSRGARIELGGRAQIAQRGGQHFGRIAAALMRLAPFQVGEHRAAFQRNGAAVGLDGHKRLPPARGRRRPGR